MPAVLMLFPYQPGMENSGFHAYEEAEGDDVPFAFPDSSVPAPDVCVRSDDASDAAD
jgi:hypothetical protein